MAAPQGRDITIANPPGLSSPDFATVESVTVRMTLAGLMRGGIDVESIDFESPVIHLERLATEMATGCSFPRLI